METAFAPEPDSHKPSLERNIRRSPRVLICATAMVACLATPALAASAPKVEVCHFPPGNPDNFHTITISDNALSAHLAHGDLPDSCNALCAELCDDGDACTVDDTDDCELRGCPTVRTPVDCSDNMNCTADSCDSVVGCINDPVVCTPSDLCHV